MKSLFLLSLGFVCLLTIPACGQKSINASSATMQQQNSTTMKQTVNKSNEEWRKELTPTQYDVTCNSATEKPFTGEYWNHHEKGMYKCVRCGHPLFSSETKYDSGSGWPSFWAPADKENVGKKSDTSHGMVRDEVVCSHCGAHLGHLFDDGPKPTGQRYCINSASLKFEKK